MPELREWYTETAHVGIYDEDDIVTYVIAPDIEVFYQLWVTAERPAVYVPGSDLQVLAAAGIHLGQNYFEFSIKRGPLHFSCSVPDGKYTLGDWAAFVARAEP